MRSNSNRTGSSPAGPRQVMDQTESFLTEVQKQGLMAAISHGKFANIARSDDGGKGLGGVFAKGPDYANPILEQLGREGVIS